MEFERFGSLTRFSQGWTITEKLDGTNAQIGIVHTPNAHVGDNEYGGIVAVQAPDGLVYTLHAGSRNRWLSLERDNMSFARWVNENAEELVKLGPGRHYGEWYGSGIQRNYGLKNGDKRFALFNALRWSDPEVRPDCCEVVHAFALNEYLDCPNMAAMGVMSMMKDRGSFQVPGFMNPEGIVMFHRKSGVAFKKTFDYDEKGKWAEQQG